VRRARRRHPGDPGAHRFGNLRRVGTELDVIRAVVIGGTQRSGGRGSVARTALGVLCLGALNNAMNIPNVPMALQPIAKGAIITAALGLGRLRSS